MAVSDLSTHHMADSFKEAAASTDTIPLAVRLRLDAALRAVPVDIRQRLIDTLSHIIWAIDKGGFDHVVVIARRMACLYKLALSCGLHHRPGIVSDRFVDALPDDAWRGQRVLIADDTCISGRTMRLRTEKIRRLVGDSGTIETNWAISLNPGSPADMTRAKDLHPQFAMSFSAAVIPYFTAFVVSNEFHPTADYLAEILEHHSAWKSVDTTNAIIADSAASSVSLFLRGESDLTSSFKARLGAAADLVSTAKVRLLIERSCGQLRCRFVPIVLTHRLPVSGLIDWLRPSFPSFRNLEVPKPSWTSADPETPEQAAMRRISDPDETPESEMGAVAAGLTTVVLSWILFDVFVDYLHENLPPRLVQKSPALSLDDDHMRFISGELLPGLQALACAPHGLNLTSTHSGDEVGFWEQDLQLEPEGKGWFYKAGDDTVESACHQLEKSAERLSPEDHRVGKRPPPIPLAMIAKQSHRNEVTSSLAIDLLNDPGAAVPEWRMAKGFVFRCLGHAEAFGLYSQIPRGRLGGRIAALPNTVCLGQTDN